MAKLRKLLTPYDFQKKIIDRAKEYNAFAFLCQAGTGKTLMAINVLRHKYRDLGGVVPTLILCPIIVLKNWKKELLLSSQIPEDRIAVIDGYNKAKRLKQLKDPNNVVIIINYEALLTEEIYNYLLAWKAKIVICDESQRIKSHTSKRFKAVMKLSSESIHRYILTGTLVDNTFFDIFAQYLFLDRGQSFGTSFVAFRSRYFVDFNATWKGSKKYFPDFRFINQRLPEIHNKLNETGVSIKKEDCLDLPDYVEQIIGFELPSETAKAYKELRDDLITFIEKEGDNPAIVPNALTKLLRLNEITTGYLKLEDGTIHKFKDNPRLGALMELLDSINHKVIIFAVYRENYSDIKAALEKKKIEYVEIHGGVSGEDKIKNVDIFNDLDNNVKVCLANPKSAGLGINLKSARYKIYYSRSHSLGDFEQSKARNYRAGSIDYHNKVTDYHLVAEGTVDAAILESLRNKQAFANKILDIKKLLG